MRKRISSVLAGLLAALLLWGLAPVTAEAAGASFSGSGSVRAGDSVTVTFTVSGSNIQGITAVLHYDSSALTLTGTRQLVGSSWSVDMSGGNLLAYDQSLSNPITGSAAVLAVTFQVKSGVAAGTRVSATITDIVATDGNSDQSLNDASWAASVAAPPSGNANLAGLSCGDYALSPAFSAGTTEYSVTVPYDVSRLPLDYRAADGGADVSVSGNQLSVGVNTVVLTVTAANGASRRYTISVTRQPDPNGTLSSDASLSELTPSTGQLSPAFSPEITEYAVYVPYETSKISLSATAKDSKALGVTQPDASLKEGDNLLTVTCTAEDGATRDYTVHVVRMPAFAGTLPQIGQPEPEDPTLEEPQAQPGPFRALWTALCAPVDLPLNRWLPMYAILAAGLVVLLVLLFFMGRAVGIARSRRRLPDRLAQMEPPQPPAEPEPAPQPEPVSEPETPAVSEETPVPPVIVPESVPAEEAPAPEAVTPPEEEVPAEETPAEETPAEPEPAPEPEEPTPETPEEAPEEPEDKPQTLDRDSLDALLEEIRNMEP
ncbi:MAG: cadherin-like beta sandwich domain-containing protein [Oscillospiraceae bacterium]|nr:cadherin-like beta sandwich domain-containing protein [Oscillospiraceae bacterium]